MYTLNITKAIKKMTLSMTLSLKTIIYELVFLWKIVIIQLNT